jgi:hypothetical protein
MKNLSLDEKIVIEINISENEAREIKKYLEDETHDLVFRFDSRSVHNSEIVKKIIKIVLLESK